MWPPAGVSLPWQLAAGLR